MSNTPKSLEDYRKYLREATSIQSETIRRLVSDESAPPLQVAAALEDIANHFLDLSDDIREFARELPEDAPRSA